MDQAAAAGGPAAQTAGALAMLPSLRHAVGTNKFLLGNIIRRGSSDTPLFMPCLDGAMAEHFLHISSDTPSDYMADIADVKYWGQQGKVVVAKGWPGFSFLDAFAQTNSESLLYSIARTNIHFPLAAYLCGAQTNSYFSYSWGYSFINTTNDCGWFSYYQDLFRRLGPPVTNYVQSGFLFTRQFANASISADVSNRVGQIIWNSPLVEILNPTNGAAVMQNSSQSVPAAVNAQDASGIRQVNYWVNDVLVASNNVAPYSVTLPNLPQPGFKLAAQAVNSNGVDSTSVAVNLSTQLPATQWTWDAGASNGNLNNPPNWVGDTDPPFDGTAIPVFGAAGSLTSNNKPGGARFYGVIFNRDENFLITYVTTQTSNLTLQGTLQIRVSVDGGATNNNRIIGLGTLGYGGSLVVSNIGLTALTAGKSFSLFSSASATGNFTNISPDRGPDLKWSFNTANGVLSVVALTSPVFSSTMLAGTNLVLGGSNGVSAAAFSLLTTTNLSLPRNQWVWFKLVLSICRAISA